MWNCFEFLFHCLQSIWIFYVLCALNQGCFSSINFQNQFVLLSIHSSRAEMLCLTLFCLWPELMAVGGGDRHQLRHYQVRIFGLCFSEFFVKYPVPVFLHPVGSCILFLCARGGGEGEEYVRILNYLAIKINYFNWDWIISNVDSSRALFGN